MADRKNNETTSWNADEVRRQQTQRKQRKKMRRARFWAIYCAGVVLGSCLLAGLGWLMVNDVCALNKAPLTATVEIEKGDSVGQIASKLKKAGLIELKGFFVLYEIFTGAKNDIDPGTYELNTSMDYRSLVHNMYDPDARRRAEEGLVLVTIPEGYSVQQIVDLLAEKGIATKEELVDAVSNFDFGEEYPFIDNSLTGQINRLEGYLFPDTYEFSTEKTAVFAIDTMLTNFNTKVSNELLSEIQESGYTFREIITMASIIEKEAIGDYEERTNVASVLYNRLNNPDAETAGLLQVDASIDYALRLEGKDRSEFSTELDSPYNTYIHAGLPVGPICNPSLASIRAALNPSQTDYYYYALGTDGVHHFFRTYSEHLAFVNSDMYAPA